MLNGGFTQHEQDVKHIKNTVSIECNTEATLYAGLDTYRIRPASPGILQCAFRM